MSLTESDASLHQKLRTKEDISLLRKEAKNTQTIAGIEKSTSQEL